MWSFCVVTLNLALALFGCIELLAPRTSWTWPTLFPAPSQEWEHQASVAGLASSRSAGLSEDKRFWRWGGLTGFPAWQSRPQRGCSKPGWAGPTPASCREGLGKDGLESSSPVRAGSSVAPGFLKVYTWNTVLVNNLYSQHWQKLPMRFWMIVGGSPFPF